MNAESVGKGQDFGIGRGVARSPGQIKQSGFSWGFRCI